MLREGAAAVKDIDLDGDDTTEAGATASAEGVTSVCVGWASVALRTRFFPQAAAAFLPEVVRALRRSSASSRLESLAMSAR